MVKWTQCGNLDTVEKEWAKREKVFLFEANVFLCGRIDTVAKSHKTNGLAFQARLASVVLAMVPVAVLPVGNHARQRRDTKARESDVNGNWRLRQHRRFGTRPRPLE